jgi:hypothetical protein
MWPIMQSAAKEIRNINLALSETLPVIILSRITRVIPKKQNTPIIIIPAENFVLLLLMWWGLG